jgi:hypothetical protein
MITSCKKHSAVDANERPPSRREEGEYFALKLEKCKIDSLKKSKSKKSPY